MDEKKELESGYGKNVLDCIYTRRTIRKYKKMSVDKDTVLKIIDAGRQAPSAGNLQNWHFVYVKDKEKKEKIAEACNDQFWMNEAPVHIIVCCETERLKKFFGTRGEKLYAIQNCAAAIQNMLLTAHYYGVGACWVGSFDESKLKPIINVPDDIQIAAVITLGYPAEEPSEPPKYRLYEQLGLENFGSSYSDVLWLTKHHAWSIENRIKKKKAELEADMPEQVEKSKDFLRKVADKFSKFKNSIQKQEKR